MKLVHSAFYRFVEIDNPSDVAARLGALGAAEQVTGSILLAREGINGAVAGAPAAVARFEAGLLRMPAFADLTFKRSDAETPPYAKFKVSVGKRIVAFAPNDEGAFVPDPTTQVTPERWRELIREDHVVVIDNRNSFEYRLGRFQGAIDPEVNHFADFEAYVSRNAAQWRAENKTVAMYCTGGIRCERVAPWMKSLGLEVAELKGGILNYFATLPDAEREWQGECFVFDNRIALDTKLQETATTELDVYDGSRDGEWRIERARRLRLAATEPMQASDREP